MLESLCRFCGKKTAKKFSLIFEDESDEEGPSLLQKINSCIPVTVSTNERKSANFVLYWNSFNFQIAEDDQLPKRLCANCLDETNNVFTFVQSILETQKTFIIDTTTIKTEHDAHESDTGRRQTRASKKRTEPTECEPFECITIADALSKSNYRERTTELEINVIPTESTKSGGKRLNEDVSNALKKLKSVARNLTVSRTTVKKPLSPVVTQQAPQRLRARIESTSDNGNDDAEVDQGDFGDDDEIKSVSSFSTEDEKDSDDDEYMPRKKKQGISSNTTKASTSGSTYKRTENFTVYKINSPPVFLCLKCDTRFPAFAALKSHISGDNECKRASLTCEICNKLCKSRKSLHGHVKGHEQKSSFVCDQCGKVMNEYCPVLGCS